MGSDCASSLLRPLHRSHGLCVFMLINTNALRSLQRSCRKTVVAMGSDCASILRPLRRSHGLCVVITNALRSLQRGCSCKLCTKCEGQSAKVNVIYNLQSTLCNVRLTIYNPHCTIRILQSTIHIVQCTL